MDEITLLVHGRERTFSRETLIAILEKHFPDEATNKEEKKAPPNQIGEPLAVKKVDKQQGKELQTKNALQINVAKKPTEGILFEIKCSKILNARFERPTGNKRQENVWETIQEAIIEARNNPIRYPSLFYTLIPEKMEEGYKTEEKHRAYAKKCGGQMANWVEQHLEWAQRILNGETWNDLCCNDEKLKWSRAVIWKDGKIKYVGGSTVEPDGRDFPTHVWQEGYFLRTTYYSVPLVRIDKK